MRTSARAQERKKEIQGKKGERERRCRPHSYTKQRDYLHNGGGGRRGSKGRMRRGPFLSLKKEAGDRFYKRNSAHVQSYPQSAQRRMLGGGRAATRAYKRTNESGGGQETNGEKYIFVRLRISILFLVGIGRRDSCARCFLLSRAPASNKKKKGRDPAAWGDFFFALRSAIRRRHTI